MRSMSLPSITAGLAPRRFFVFTTGFCGAPYDAAAPWTSRSPVRASSSPAPLRVST